MKTALATRPAPMVTMADDGHAFTTSRDVAAVFGKRHDHVLRDIDRLLADDDPDFNAPNFGAVEYLDEKGETRRMFHLTRDGFTLLAMGFTGPQALRWKKAYITAFNAMEARLRGLHMLPEEEDRDMHRKVSPRLWPILHKQSHALLVQVKTATDPDVRRNAFWALYRVNTALGIPVPSMQVLGVQPLALPAANAPDVSR